MAESPVTPQRFAQGMTFEQYVAYIGTPENLAREGSTLAGSAPRKDWSAFMRARYAKTRLTDAQVASMRWLAKQPGGPARLLVISEDWSSDCRRDVPYLQRLADAGGLELRIFNRDGRSLLKGAPDPASSPNADLMAHYMSARDGQRYASIPVAAFFDRDFNELYRYVEFPAIYHKDRLVAEIRGPRAGETAEQTKARGGTDFFAMLESPFFDVWADAAIAEILSALHERCVLAGGRHG
ncbi:MAG: thioredoxin family protein [Candidatus Rokubacteria bacterium]|nr:thioredoxin family protein [Candidatus Rokubacteria bacterium]